MCYWSISVNVPQTIITTIHHITPHHIIHHTAPHNTNLSGVSRVNDSVVPEARGGVKGVGFLLVLVQNRLFERSLLISWPDLCVRKWKSDCDVENKESGQWRVVSDVKVWMLPTKRHTTPHIIQNRRRITHLPCPLPRYSLSAPSPTHSPPARHPSQTSWHSARGTKSWGNRHDHTCHNCPHHRSQPPPSWF